MIRLKAASIVSVMLFGTAQIKNSEVNSMNGNTIPFGTIRGFLKFVEFM
jgi:hypothetical protein